MWTGGGVTITLKLLYVIALDFIYRIKVHIKLNVMVLARENSNTDITIAQYVMPPLPSAGLFKEVVYKV